MAKSNVKKKPISNEEYTTNKVLSVFSICLLGVLVLMVLQRLLNYADTYLLGRLVTKVILVIGGIVVLWGLYLLMQERAGRRKADNRVVCGRNVVVVGVVAVLIMSLVNYLGLTPIKGLYVVLPVLAVYYLIYHSYAPEFFLISLDTGAGLGLMWFVHRALASLNYSSLAYAGIGAMVVIALVQIALVASLRGKKGKFTLGGRTFELHLSRNAYTMLYVTPIVMTALVAAVLVAPQYLLIALGAGAAYLFVTAVYYTVKLM